MPGACLLLSYPDSWLTFPSITTTWWDALDIFRCVERIYTILNCCYLVVFVFKCLMAQSDKEKVLNKCIRLKWQQRWVKAMCGKIKLQAKYLRYKI